MKKICLVLALLFLVVSVHDAGAVALGVNRASLSYDNVLRQGYAEDFVTVTTDTSNELGLEHYFEGDIADWFSLEPSNESDLYFSSSKPLRLKIIVEPPEDAANGVYQAKLRLLTGAFGRTGGQYGSSVRASFTVKIAVTVTGDEIVSCTAGGYDIVDTETGYPLQFQGTVHNTGNVRLRPSFEIDIWDQYQTRVVHSTTLEQADDVLPTTQENFVDIFESNLPIGQYWASIREPVCGNSQTLTFSILELGGISDNGELLRLDHEAWGNTNDIVRIAAIFKNLGARVVNAKFTGTISKDDKVVEVIDTDPLNVRPEEVTEFETFFNPTEPGRYTITGRVIYNNKLTFKKSSILTVRGEVGPRVTGNFVTRMVKNPYQAAMFFIMAMIGTLLFLIRKEKKRRRPF